MARLIEPGPGFTKLFQEFEHTAFRLETRDHYSSPREAESFRKFVAGELDASYHENWLDLVRRATAEGRLFSRVRVVSTPFSNYTRFSMWIAGYTSDAGDDIRYLSRERAAAAGIPSHDYWLFDSRLLLMMHFGEDDKFIDAEVIEDPVEIVQHNYWRDTARRYATLRNDFVEEYG